MQRKGHDQKAGVQCRGREVERGGEGKSGSESSHSVIMISVFSVFGRGEGEVVVGATVLWMLETR